MSRSTKLCICSLSLLALILTGCGGSETPREPAREPGQIEIDKDYSSVYLVEVFRGKPVVCVYTDGYQAGGTSCDWELFHSGEPVPVGLAYDRDYSSVYRVEVTRGKYVVCVYTDGYKGGGNSCDWLGYHEGYDDAAFASLEVDEDYSSVYRVAVGAKSVVCVFTDGYKGGGNSCDSLTA